MRPMRQLREAPIRAPGALSNPIESVVVRVVPRLRALGEQPVERHYPLPECGPPS